MAKQDFDFICYGCGQSAALSGGSLCAHCGEPRSIRALGSIPETRLRHAPQTLWHYLPLLPVHTRKAVVTLGEGGTPLVHAPRLAERFGFAELSFKNEMANPTGSFKDRQVSVGISHAMEMGADTVAAVSSGNVASATAAYAARAGIRAVLFMHAHASPAKIAQAGVYGARVLRIDSPAPSVVFGLCMEACRKWGWSHLSTAGIYEPYNVEGAKTIAYELYQQYQGDLPDWIVAPVGGGGLLGGIWRGFLDLERMGYIERAPRLAGVQAAGCAPLIQAIKRGTPFLETLKHPWPDPKTIAGGIADDILFDGHTVLPALRRTGGTAIAVDDESISAGLESLAREEGILCELTSAVVLAALPHLPRDEGLADCKPRVCCVLTGHGIKDLPYLSKRTPDPPLLPPSLNAVEKCLADGK